MIRTFVIILTFLSASLGRCGTPCDSNSAAPLISYDLIPTAEANATTYDLGTVSCKTSNRIPPDHRSHFEVSNRVSNYYVDDRDITDFYCGIVQKSGQIQPFIPQNAKLLSAAFAGSGIKLENCKYAVVSPVDTHKSERQTIDQKQTSQAQGMHPAQAKTANGSNDQSSLNLKDNDRRLIVEALQQSGGDTAQAAKKLGISERALLRKIKEYKLDATAR